MTQYCVEIIYRWFSNKDDVIIDPFAGGSVRGVVASYLDRNYIGIDLRQEQIDANNFNFKEINEQNPIKYKPKWICGDSIKIKELTNNIEADLIFSCPPYYNLEVYSELEGDISNLSSYEDFKKQYFAIIKNTCNQLKNNRFACFVVGEIRDKKGFYRNFVGDTIEAFKQGGLNYYNEAILLTNIGSLSLRAPKQFNSSRKLGKGHQNVLIFYKGDCSKIKERYKEIIID